METLAEDSNSNPILKHLKLCNYRITQSIRHQSNIFCYHSGVEPVAEHFNWISQSNFISTEKLVKYEVLKENRFRWSNTTKEDSLRPIGSLDIECSHETIKNLKIVNQKKKRMIELLRADVKRLDDNIPELEEKVKDKQRSIEEYLSNSIISVDPELNNKANHFNKLKQEMNSKYTEIVSEKNEPNNILYCTYDLKKNLSPLMEMACTDLKLVYNCISIRFVNKIGWWDNYKFSIEEFSQRVADLKINSATVISKQQGHAKCEKLLLDVKSKCSGGNFECFPEVNFSRRTKIIELNEELNKLTKELSQNYEEQNLKQKQTLEDILMDLRMSSLLVSLNLVNNLDNGFRIITQFQNLIRIFIALEQCSLTKMFYLLSFTNKKLDDYFEQNKNFKTELKQKIHDHENDKATKIENTVEVHYVKRLLVQKLPHIFNLKDSFNRNLEDLINELDMCIKREKQRVIHEYHLDQQFKREATLRNVKRQVESKIYSGPLDNPVHPSVQEHKELEKRLSDMLSIQLQYYSLIQKIQNMPNTKIRSLGSTDDTTSRISQ